MPEVINSFHSFKEGDVDYHVTKHAVDRFSQRVLDSDKEFITVNEANKIKRIIFDEVKDNLGFAFKIKVQMPLYDCYAVIENGIVVTIFKK